MSEKHFVCKGATVYCSKSMVNNNPGTAIPLTITSQMLVELNGGKTAATDKDCTPANMCFGTCNSGSNPPPPCVANVQWSKFYEDADVTEAGMKLLTEESEATCMTFGGKVKVAFHGQTASPQPVELATVSPEIMSSILPVDPDKETQITIEEKKKQNKKEKVQQGCVTDAYWIDGATGEQMRELHEGREISLCLETQGFKAGEQASVKIVASDGHKFENGNTEMTVSGIVNSDKVAVVEKLTIKYK